MKFKSQHPLPIGLRKPSTLSGVGRRLQRLGVNFQRQPLEVTPDGKAIYPEDVEKRQKPIKKVKRIGAR